MSNKTFNFTDALSYGWNVMKANIGFFIGLMLLFFVISNITSVIIHIVKALNLPSGTELSLVILLNIVSWVISFIVGIGMFKIALSFCDEQKPSISKLFDAFDCFWRYIGVAILYTLIVIGGFLLLIVPGIIWAVKFSLSLYFVIDKGLGPVNALKASSRATMGVKWQLFGFQIVCSLINFLGILCLFIGIFATYPTVLIAMALVYRQLAAQTPELAELISGEQKHIMDFET